MNMKRKLLPRTLFGRMVLIIMLPLLLVQVVTVLVFYGRHWDTVTRYMTNNLTADMHIIADNFAAADNTADGLAEARDFAGRYFAFRINWEAGATLPPQPATAPQSAPFTQRMLHLALADRLGRPFAYELYDDPDTISVFIGFNDGVMEIIAGRKRIFSSTSWLVILYTVSTSVLFFVIALAFTRGQVRPIRRLAKAARSLGLGRPVADFKLEGAREVRLAGIAFQTMRQRILRQLVERTEMLAGVSHDLRTPLTRLKLQLAGLPQGARRKAMEQDIREMESMINGYIDFASHAVVEDAVATDITAIIRDSVAGITAKGDAGFGKAGSKSKNASRKKSAPRIAIALPEGDIPLIPLRARSLRRALDNIIGNAIRHAANCTITLEVDREQIQIIIDDDGPGIPKDRRISVLRPFVKFDDGDDAHQGAGLGLSIANDTALAHGGLLLLGDSPQGGLRVRMQLPI